MGPDAARAAEEGAAVCRKAAMAGMARRVAAARPRPPHLLAELEGRRPRGRGGGGRVAGGPPLGRAAGGRRCCAHRCVGRRGAAAALSLAPSPASAAATSAGPTAGAPSSAAASAVEGAHKKQAQVIAARAVQIHRRMHLLPRVWLPHVLLHATVRGRQLAGAWPLLTEGERRERGRAPWKARLQPYRRVRLRCAVDDLPVALLLFHTSLRCLSSLPPSSPPLQGKLCMTRHYYETWSPPCAQSESYGVPTAAAARPPGCLLCRPVTACRPELRWQLVCLAPSPASAAATSAGPAAAPAGACTCCLAYGFRVCYMLLCVGAKTQARGRS